MHTFIFQHQLQFKTQMNEDQLKEDQLKELAAQLRLPHAEKGISMANMMQETNSGMIASAIAAMKLQPGDKVLELGPGNGAHISAILESAEHIHYTALEISELMQQEAIRLNTAAFGTGQALFELYDGLTIPCADNLLDKGLTVNTLYFWEKPVELLQEIYRILKPGATFCITFAQRNFMEQLPFTKYGFELYDTQKAKDLIGQTSFEIQHVETTTESIKSNTGDFVNRDYTTITIRKEIPSTNL
jgi:ubiquinone/menaquinone biosynthesis C-methylase UbiE